MQIRILASGAVAVGDEIRGYVHEINGHHYADLCCFPGYGSHGVDTCLGSRRLGRFPSRFEAARAASRKWTRWVDFDAVIADLKPLDLRRG